MTPRQSLPHAPARSPSADHCPRDIRRPASRKRRPRRRRPRTGWEARVRRASSTRAHRSTARPPWVWNSAPVTRTALSGGDSGGTAAKARPNLSVPPSRFRRSTSAKVFARASPGSFSRVASSSMLSASMIAPPASACRKSSNCRAMPAMRASKMPKAIAGRLAQDLRRLLGIAVALVGEALAVDIDLKAALHDRRPGDEDAVRMRDRAVALIARHVDAALRPAPRPRARRRRDCPDGRNRARRPSPGCAARTSADCRHSRCRRAPAPRSRSARACRPAA